jgi:hypothetical protein
MVEREPVTDAGAAIMAGQTEVNKAERLHGVYHGLSHSTLGVGRMVRLRRRRRRPAVTRQIGNHERKALRQRRCRAVAYHAARKPLCRAEL